MAKSSTLQICFQDAAVASNTLNGVLYARTIPNGRGDVADPAWPLSYLVRDAIGILQSGHEGAALSRAMFNAVLESGRLQRSDTEPSKQLKDIASRGLQVMPPPPPTVLVLGLLKPGLLALRAS